MNKVSLESNSSFVKAMDLNTNDEEQDESKPKSEKKTVIPTAAKIEFVKPKNHEKPVKKSVSLGKFDGKSDEGFFVGYSLSSKAFRVYNTRTKRVEENLHSGFLENKPMIEGTGTVSNDSTGTSEENSQDCIVMLIWKDTSYFDSPTKDVDNGEPKIAGDAQKQVEDGLNNENVEQERFADDSSTKDVNDVGQQNSTEEEPEVNLGNITNSYIVPNTPDTRIYKDHPIDNVISEVQSTIQTRRMSKPTSEQGFLSDVYEQKTHDTLNTCLYACFLSYIEPTSIAKALSDSSWMEAMQEELLQFKLQQFGILGISPNGKKAIGIKWVFKNKKDERGIVIRNKARLVAQGHRQEECIDYKEVFALVARIEAIRLFLVYASFMGFLVPGHPDKVYKRGHGTIWFCIIAPRLVYVDDIILWSQQTRSLCIEKKMEYLLVRNKYVAEILKKFNYSDVKSASTPVDLGKPLVQDIMFAVCACARFQVTPKTSHLLAVKRIFRYLKVTMLEQLLRYEIFTLRGEGGGLSSFWETRLISWQCVKAKLWVATSQLEAEYVAAASCCGQVGDEAVHKELGDRMERAATTASSLEAEQDSGSGPRCQDTILGDVNAQTRFEITSKQSINPPLSRGYTLGSGEDTKDAQAKEIAALKKRIQRLERRKMSRPTGLKRLRKVVLEDDVMYVEAKVDGKDEHSTKPDDSTTGEAGCYTTTIEEITLSQTLIQIKAAKPKVVTTAATTTTTTRPQGKQRIEGRRLEMESAKGSWNEDAWEG
ncbi:putative ribonuclease H-like domain-containing protein [Tanacetum coccineum]